MPLERSSIEAPLRDPHLVLDVRSDEVVLRFVRLRTSRKDRTSSWDSEKAVTSMETSVVEPEKTGNTAA